MLEIMPEFSNHLCSRFPKLYSQNDVGSVHRGAKMQMQFTMVRYHSLTGNLQKMSR